MRTANPRSSSSPRTRSPFWSEVDGAVEKWPARHQRKTPRRKILRKAETTRGLAITRKKRSRSPFQLQVPSPAKKNDREGSATSSLYWWNRSANSSASSEASERLRVCVCPGSQEWGVERDASNRDGSSESETVSTKEVIDGVESCSVLGCHAPSTFSKGIVPPHGVRATRVRAGESGRDPVSGAERVTATGSEWLPSLRICFRWKKPSRKQAHAVIAATISMDGRIENSRRENSKRECYEAESTSDSPGSDGDAARATSD